ncbi:MAG: hypothetical protein KatS3mg030_152 [Saprospiraceae bacterium]|nr:MAG: hypothetical protein KatS3mg030_152 [Saprospiraceae bacterium]
MNRPITRSITSQFFSAKWTCDLASALLCVAMLFPLMGQAQNCTMACNNLVNVSLPAACEAEITYDMVLEGSYQTCQPNGPTAFEVEVSYQGVPIPTSPFVTAANIGQTLMVKVTHWASGNSCWGNIKVEDKLPPALSCPPDLTVACTADTSPVSTGYPIVSDCSPVTTTYYSITQNQNCNGPFAATISRTWTAFDDYGNVSQCTQLIQIENGLISQVVFPPNLDGISNPALDCVNPNTDPSNTGQPSIGGHPIPPNGGGYCQMGVSYTDQIIPICENSYKILRNWVVVSWCTGGIATYLQIIAVKDTTPPQATCPPNMTVGTNSSQSCTATFILPPASISDNCSSSFVVSMNTPVGLIMGNGGLIKNVPLGNHTITYNVADNCGNSTTCQMSVQVVDQSPPTVVCDAYTVVALNNNGVAVVFAQTFDDGSYDNCSSVSFSVRRMTAACGTQPVFGPTVKFCCSDVGDDVQVEMKATDAAGNSNTCMVTVHVEDHSAPLLTCPPDVTIACTENYNDLNLTGEPQVSEPCGLAEYFYQNSVNLNMCNVGTVVRTWTAIDSSGNSTSCSHTITLQDNTPPQITFPPNYAITSCTSPDQLHPDSLPSPYNGPVISSDCELMAVNWSDQIFTVAPPACFKIVRTWKVINWCTYQPGGNTGIWQAQQIIMVTDHEPPTFTCPQDFTVEVDTNCTATVTLPSVTNIEDCSNDVQVEVLTNLGFGSGPFSNVPPGSYGATYIVSDGCGNSNSCQINIEVVDKLKPTPYCKNGLIIEIMNSQPPMVEVWASDFNAGSFDNCSANLQFSFSSDTDSTSMVLTCDDLGQTNIQMWVTDEAGNQDYCETFLLLQDNMGACSGPLVANVGGAIATEMGYAVQDVMVLLNDSLNNMAMTGPDGEFFFENLLTGFDYTVTPAKDTNVFNGVTTFDIVLIRKHVLNIQPLDSPYKMIAADANRSNTITTADMVAIQKVILHEVDTFPHNKSWRFVDAAYQFPNPQNPWVEAFPEVYNINDLSGDMDSIGFVAIKIGDVNNSATPNELYKPTDSRSFGTLAFKTADAKLSKGTLARMAVRAEDFENIIGFQFTFHFDPSALRLTGIEPGALPLLGEDNFGFALLEKGVLTASWNDVTPHTLDADQIIFTLVFETMADVRLSEAVGIGSDFTTAEAYLEDGTLLDVALHFDGAEQAPSHLQAGISPNPFSQGTTLQIQNPADQLVRLTVLDVQGRIVFEEEKMLTKGYHNWYLDQQQLPATGTYLFKIVAGGSAWTGKALRVH